MKAAAGENFDVELGSAPTTGYLWQLPSLPDGVHLVDRDFGLPAGAAVGEGGTQRFRLRADTPGRYELHFELQRQWESEPIQTTTIELDVT